MKPILLYIFLTLTCVFSLQAQKLANGNFNYTCPHNGDITFLDAFSSSTNRCGLSPWLVSHGSPDVGFVNGIEIPEMYCASVKGGAGFGNIPVGNEGIFQNYNFVKGNRYYLRAYVKAFANDYSTGDADKVFIAMTNGLQPKFENVNSADYAMPTNSREDIWIKENVKLSWTLIDLEFVPTSDYTQIWISLSDDDADRAVFEVAGLYVSCCPYDKNFNNVTVPTSTTNTENKISTTGNVTVVSGQNVIFNAGKEISLTPSFTSQVGSTFKASINNVCDCSPGAGNVVNMCSAFNGSIDYIIYTNQTGVYVPNVFYRDVQSYFNFTSYGYTKPYNAYYWRFRVWDRWGLKVYDNSQTSGVDGFTNGSIKWNGGDVSASVYNVQLDLANCTSTYTYTGQVSVLGTAHPNARTALADTTSMPDRLGEVKPPEEFADVTLLQSVDKTFLYDAYPNPATNLVTFQYSVLESGFVSLTLTNQAGTIQKKLIVEDEHPSGFFRFNYQVDNYAPGIYFYTLQTDKEKVTKKIIVVR